MRAESSVFWRDEAQCFAGSLECLDDFELLAVEVDVFPAQSEQFTAAQSEVQRQDVERVKAQRRGDMEGLSSLRCCQHAIDFVGRNRDLDELGDVARKNFLPHGAFQSIPEYGVRPTR